MLINGSNSNKERKQVFGGFSLFEEWVSVLHTIKMCKHVLNRFE